MEAFGDPSEKAWVAGKAIVMFEGRHQFEELPVLRKRGKQKEKGYRHKVKTIYKQKNLKNSSSCGLAYGRSSVNRFGIYYYLQLTGYLQK